MPKNFTIFLDIDGCLLEHLGNATDQLLNQNPKLLPNVIEKLDIWEREGHQNILTTGRRKSMKKKTIQDLNKLGIIYDKLIMGCNVKRVVINDIKSLEDKTAFAFNIHRNEGLNSIDLNII